MDLIRLAKAHCGLVLHRTFAASVRRLADEARRPRPGFYLLVIKGLACGTILVTMLAH